LAEENSGKEWELNAQGSATAPQHGREGSK